MAAAAAGTLAARLRTGTAEAHQRAERAPVIGRIVSLKMDAQDYVEYLAALLRVYEALESRVAQLCAAPAAQEEHAWLRDLASQRELARCDALREDLAFLAGSQWRARADGAVPGAHSYAAHLATLPPHLLLAHIYARYIGDLSGGQILRRKVATGLGLALGGPGLAFYSFPLIADVRAFKDGFRDALSALPLAPAQQAEVVREANLSFALNETLFHELEARHLARCGDESVWPRVQPQPQQPEPQPKRSRRALALILLALGLALAAALALRSSQLQ
jgi:heme oxygenase